MALKWGILGAGLISERNMIPAMLNAANAKPVAVMDVNASRAKEVAAKFRIEKIVTSEESLLACDDVEAVYIATPAHCHAQQVIAAAEHGKHILCEKPLALTIRDGEAMMAACKANRVQLGMGFMMRYHPHHLRARDLIRTGMIGDIVKARIQWNFRYPPQSGLWRQDPQRGGGGCMMDVGVHCVDLLHFLVGEIEEVVALSDNVVFHYPVEDVASVLLRFDGGAHGLVDTSFAVDSKHSPNGIEVYGTKGRIATHKTVSCFVGGSMVTLIDGNETSYPASEVDTYQKEVEAFAEALAGGGTPAVDENGLHALKVVLAAYESARSGKRVRVT